MRSSAKEVESAGGIALAVPTDVAGADQVEAAAQRVEDTFGPIDVWVNDAMVTVFAPFTEMTPEEFLRATSVTYMGAVYGTMAALKRMRPRDRGAIVQVGSALSYRAIPLQAPYCASKYAVEGLTLRQVTGDRIFAPDIPAGVYRMDDEGKVLHPDSNWAAGAGLSSWIRGVQPSSFSLLR